MQLEEGRLAVVFQNYSPLYKFGDVVQVFLIAFEVVVVDVDLISIINAGVVDQWTDEDRATDRIDFTINDPDTSLEELKVTVTSDNQTLIPDENIVLGGSGQQRNVIITPAPGQNGTAKNWAWMR